MPFLSSYRLFAAGDSAGPRTRRTGIGKGPSWLSVRETFKRVSASAGTLGRPSLARIPFADGDSG